MSLRDHQNDGYTLAYPNGLSWDLQAPALALVQVSCQRALSCGAARLTRAPVNSTGTACEASPLLRLCLPSPARNRPSATRRHRILLSVCPSVPIPFLTPTPGRPSHWHPSRAHPILPPLSSFAFTYPIPIHSFLLSPPILCASLPGRHRLHVHLQTLLQQNKPVPSTEEREGLDLRVCADYKVQANIVGAEERGRRRI